MLPLTEITTRLEKKKLLRREDVREFLIASIEGQYSIDDQKSVLNAINEKGFDGTELAYFIEVLLEQMSSDLAMRGAVDICGTGGSGLDRINTSTIASFILSACGVPVAKHGNKAASGRFGSFDLLEQLGVNIASPPPSLEYMYREIGLAFIFARSFHPAMKHFAEARAALGKKTVFNLLGPLLNPARPEVQLIGVSDVADMPLIVEAARMLGKQKMLVVCGADGLDEVTITGPTQVMELSEGEIREYQVSPDDFGFEKVAFSEIAGGNQQTNIRLAEDIISGDCSSAHMNLVLANVSAVLTLIGKTSNYKEGVRLAKAAIANGNARAQLDRARRLSHLPDILAEIVAYKKEEVSRLTEPDISKQEIKCKRRGFKEALLGKTDLSIIAEIKFGSPSNPEIRITDDPIYIARQYEKNGAAAISVLTDEKYFKGDVHRLKAIREATGSIPLLMKDFFIDPRQLYLAKRMGADAVLLIVSLLDHTKLEHFLSLARELEMDCLVEVHDERELLVALKSSADIIGINNRNLHNFEINTKTTLKLLSQVPCHKVLVAESGYSEKNLSPIQGSCDAVLVGTSLMQEADVGKALRKMKTPQKAIKICGIRSAETAKYCEANNIAFAGMNFVPSSKRCISIENARLIRRELKQTAAVGVFQNQPVGEINEIARQIDIDFVQLSGNETVEDCIAIERPVIKTINGDSMPTEKALAEFGKHVQYFIVDANSPGSGMPFDWDAIKELRLSRPYILAGGITPENADDALNATPYAIGVDVASGVESGNDVDPEKIGKLKTVLAGRQV